MDTVVTEDRNTQFANRLKTIMRANHIFASEIYSQTKTDSRSKILYAPTGQELIDLRNYLSKRLPNFNFDFLVGHSSNPNKVLNMNEVNYLLDENHISKDKFDEKMKTFGYRDAYNRFMSGNGPKEADVENIYNFLMNKGTVVDEEEIMATEEKKPKGATPRYITNPNDFVKNEIDSDIFFRLIKEDQWNTMTLARMIANDESEVGSIESFVRRPNRRKSLKLDHVANLEAAFQCDIDYLNGKRSFKRAPSRKRYFVEAPGFKDFQLNWWVIHDLSLSDLRELSRKSGIGFSVLKFAASNAIKFDIRLTKVDAIRIYKSGIILGRPIDEIFTYLNGATITENEMKAFRGLKTKKSSKNEPEKKEEPTVIVDIAKDNNVVEEAATILEEDPKEESKEEVIIEEKEQETADVEIHETTIQDVVDWISSKSENYQLYLLEKLINIRRKSIEMEEQKEQIKKEEENVVRSLLGNNTPSTDN